MTFVCFVEFSARIELAVFGDAGKNPGRAAQSDALVTPALVETLRSALSTIPGIQRFVIHQPPIAEPATSANLASSAKDPYLAGEPAPALVLQLYCAELTEIEKQLAPGGVFKAIEEGRLCPALQQFQVAHQVMLVRGFSTPEPLQLKPAGMATLAFTYLVAYCCVAEDQNAWLAHYLARHVPLMLSFPAIRQVEIYTRVDWISGVQWPRADAMQRNITMFDDEAGLARALNSPVRHAMRRDFESFPNFTGNSPHYPMTSQVYVIDRSAGSDGTGSA